MTRSESLEIPLPSQGKNERAIEKVCETFAKRRLRAHKSFSTPRRLAQGSKG